MVNNIAAFKYKTLFSCKKNSEKKKTIEFQIFLLGYMISISSSLSCRQHLVRNFKILAFYV